MIRNTSISALAQDARLLTEGKAIPIGGQGTYNCAGQWEIAQTTNSKDWGATELFHWVLTPFLVFIDPANALPKRTLAADLYLRANMNPLEYPDSGITLDNEYVFFSVESYWDKAGTILADKYEIGFIVIDGELTKLANNTSQSIFCPITDYGPFGEGTASHGIDLPMVTLRFARNPTEIGSWSFGDFRVMQTYLPSDNYVFSDKT